MLQLNRMILPVPLVLISPPVELVYNKIGISISLLKKSAVEKGVIDSKLIWIEEA